MKKVIYTQKTLSFILEALEYKVDSNDFIHDKNEKYCVDVDGELVKSKNIIGIYKDQFITKPSQILSLKLEE